MEFGVWSLELLESSARTVNSRRGVALYVVVFVVVLLALAGYAFLSFMTTEYEATTMRGREIQVQHVLQSGGAWIESLLTLSDLERQKIGGFYDNPRQFCAIVATGTHHEDLNTGRFTILSPKIENSAITGVRYGLTNESSKLHLGKILQWETAMPDAGKNALLNLPGMTETMAESILDWIDPDNITRLSGAEEAEYKRMKRSYGPRNAVPDLLEELMLVRDVTRDNLFGGDENFNFIPDAMESGKSRRNVPMAWKHFLTAFSAERDASPEGFARIDLNQENLEFLHQLLEQRVSRQAADFVILFRQFGPTELTGAYFEDGKIISQTLLSPRDAEAERTMDFSVPGEYTFQTPLDAVDLAVAIPDEESLLPGPFQWDGQRFQGDLLRFLDQVSASPTTTIVGRVNINLAQREVLLSVPGLTPQMVQNILSRRPPPETAGQGSSRHPTWLLEEQILDLDTLKMLWNDITCGGDVFHGQVIGFYDEIGTFARNEVTIDATVFPPRQLFPKDLTSYGIGFSNPILFGHR